MALISQEQAQQIRTLIEAIEAETDAEMVTVLVRQSDAYRFIPLLWSATFSLFTPAPFLFWSSPVPLGELFVLQLVVFCMLCYAFTFPRLRMALVPRSIKHWRAANMARRQFLEMKVHRVHGGQGMLIFVSELERYVEILADHGISASISDDAFKDIVAHFVEDVHAGRIFEGFQNCVLASGDLLKTHYPKTRGDKDELPNHLVLIGYD